MRNTNRSPQDFYIFSADRFMSEKVCAKKENIDKKLYDNFRSKQEFVWVL
jgi:hypothetical protein